MRQLNAFLAFLYSLGEFSVIDFKPPYSPLRYIEAINFLEGEGFELVIIDSISHEWDGESGCLDMHDKAGGRFQDWAKITPLHRKLFDSVRRADMHVICAMRKKTDYALDQKYRQAQTYEGRPKRRTTRWGGL